MVDRPDELMVRVSADIAPYREGLRQASEITRQFGLEGQKVSVIGRQFGRQITKAFGDVILRGKDLNSTIGQLGLSLSKVALNQAFAPVESTIGRVFSSAFSGFEFAKGGALQGGRVLPFARGGVLSSPLAFPMRNGAVGLAGEAGPEAILPLTRGADGRLGVNANGSTGGVNITFNVNAQDAESFVRSEAQVAAMLNRVVSRGSRNL